MSTLSFTSAILSSHHHHHHLPSPPPSLCLSRRSFLFLSTTTTTSLPSPISSPSPAPPLDTTITDRIFMDFSTCPSFLRSDRPISESDPSSCSDPLPLGRIVLGLYGNLVPTTVSHFKTLCTHPTYNYKGSLVHKIFPGQFFLAGRQGNKSNVKPGRLNLSRNNETVKSSAFKLEHNRGGVLSLCLSENDDDEDVKLDPEYRNVEFLITTGPGPAPQLDSKNIVFGTVIEGMDVIAAISSIPTYKTSEIIRQFNDLAEFFGDERAQNARAIWNKPMKTVYISDCGELKVIYTFGSEETDEEISEWLMKNTCTV